MQNVCDYKQLGLRPASFKGITFYVKSATEGVGRRIATHEYPMRDVPFHEDMGKKTSTFKVEGYVYGATGRALKDALLSACGARGAGLLVLPHAMPVRVVCETAQATFELDRLGYYTVSMDFKADPGLVAGPLSVLSFASNIANTFTSLTSAVTSTFLSGFTTALQVIGVVNGAVSMVTGIGAAVIGSIQGLSALGTSAGMTLAAAAVVRDATILMNRADDLVQMPAGRTTPDETIITSIAALVEDLDAILPLEVAPQTFRTLATFTPIALPGTIRAPSDAVAIQNEDRLAGAFRRLCLAKYAENVARTTYATRQQAVQVRADLVELFYDALLAADFDEAIVQALTTCRDNAVQALTASIADLTPIITLETNASLPALYWAGFLYNDGNRAQELAERNALVDWLHLGGEFTAKAN